MIGHIVKHEWRMLVRERVLFVTIPIYALLIACGVYNGATWKNFLDVNTRAASAMVEDNLGRLQSTFDKLEKGIPLGVYEDPRFAGRMARTTGFEFATKPPEATAALAIGQSDVYPSYLKVQWRSLFRQSNTDETENPDNLRSGRFDLSFVLVYLYPLLILALSFNILSAEREGGTQALLLSQPVSVRQFVLGKIALRGVVLIGIALVLSLLGVLVSSPDIVTAGALWRIGMWALVVSTYGIFWFGLAVLVNAFGMRSSTNALILIGSWLAVVLLVPAALNLVAKSAYPLPSRIELVQAMRRGDAIALRQSSEQNEARASDLASRSGEDAQVDTLREFYKSVIPVEARAEAVSAPIFRRFNAQMAAQQSLAARLKYLSPAILGQMAMSELADNSSATYTQFNAQVAAYHQRYRDYFLPLVMQSRSLTRADVAGLPRFEYSSPREADVFGRVLSDLLWLLLFAGAVLLAGFARLRRYPAAGR